MERGLIREYRSLIETVTDKLGQHNIQVAIDLARAPADIRGFGPVKQAALKEYRARETALLAALDAPEPAGHEQPIFLMKRR
jgi:indolepyruvate ferredoxin oxidoreductase